MKKIGKFLLAIVESVVIVFVVCTIILLMSTNKFGYRQIGDITMVSIDDKNIVELNKFTEGDLVTLKEANYNDLNIGDVVYYYATYKNKYIVVYGTLEKKSGNNREAIYTFSENPDATVTGNRIIGRLNKNYVGGGKIYNLLTSTIGFLVCVILPILIIFIYQVYKFVILLREDRRNDDNADDNVKNDDNKESKTAIVDAKNEGDKNEQKIEAEVEPVKEEVAEPKPEPQVEEIVKDDDAEDKNIEKTDIEKEQKEVDKEVDKEVENEKIETELQKTIKIEPVEHEEKENQITRRKLPKRNENKDEEKSEQNKD